MALIQVRDVPDHLYRSLVEQAEKERRSLAQQVVAVLGRGLAEDVDAKSRRRKVLEAIRAARPIKSAKLSEPAKLVREDRRR